MDITASIQIFVLINILIIGLSHLLQPKIWIDFFIFLHSKGQVGNVFNAMLALGMGSIIIAFHQEWTWPAIIITLYGLLLTLKGAIYLIIPSIGLKSIGTIKEGTHKFQLAGVLMIVIALFLGFQL